MAALMVPGVPTVVDNGAWGTVTTNSVDGTRGAIGQGSNTVLQGIDHEIWHTRGLAFSLRNYFKEVSLFLVSYRHLDYPSHLPLKGGV